MKNLILLITLLSSITIVSQNELDIKIDEGIKLYESGKKKSALKIWKKVELKSSKSSSTYGTSLHNILYYYTKAGNEKKSLEYYKKIIFSDLNDKDLNNQLGQPFKNYRFHSNMTMASFYANRKKFKTSLYYVEKADSIHFETTSLTSYIYQKIDLAFWKYRLLKDLKQDQVAISKLIKRAFEYEYKKMHPNWTTFSPNNDEIELAETICSEFKNLNDFKLKVDFAIENLEISKNYMIIFKLDGVIYNINPYSNLSINEAKEYLKNSFFYNYLYQEISH